MAETLSVEQLMASTNDYEKIVANYLMEATQNGNTVLSEKIEKSQKKISDCFAYITYKAREKLAKNQNCVAIEDSTVFGWATHYYDEEGKPSDFQISKSARRAAASKTPVSRTVTANNQIVRETTTPVTVVKREEENEQLSLF